MNILLISQCQKAAIKETRRIIDQFAERCGDKVWQTAITQAGLNTLHQLLRKTARKNTAVACYWTHGKNKTDLLWIVGNRQRFNPEGRFPTNQTQRNILRSESENDWQYTQLIQTAASLAALLHDLGKATEGFQQKLMPQHKSNQGDPYRHEWLSLRLFQRMIKDCDTDHAWLTRLSDWRTYVEENPNWHQEIILETEKQYDFSSFPPFARMIAWLIVSHHRLPFINDYQGKKSSYKKESQKDDSNFLTWSLPNKVFEDLKPKSMWVKNDNAPYNEYFQKLKNDPTRTILWLNALTRWSKKAKDLIEAKKITESCYQDPLLMHLTRLCLMAGDHFYSSLAKDDKQRIKIKNTNALIANTNSDKTPKQTLDEHLCGVEKYSKEFAYILPNIAEKLDGISESTARILRKKTTLDAFKWQNRAYEETSKWQTESKTHGFFAVNMASTGCGKTLGNIKIMSALASRPEGMRCTIALGLRTLTLQTGNAIRQLLTMNEQPFNESEIVTLIGSQAIKNLFEADQNRENLFYGSESQQNLFSQEEIFDLEIPDHDQLNTVLGKSNKMRQLLFTPLVTCTIDHLMEISEQKRGGRYIAPMLRLLSSDLILDEPDEFSIGDLPAFSRLVFWAGMLGSRVILSSATLSPDFVTGLYRAYRDGRQIYNRHHGRTTANIVCAWFDEKSQHSLQCAEPAAFIQAHQQFCQNRIKALANYPVRRKADWLTLENAESDTLAKILLKSAKKLHTSKENHQVHPQTQQKISIGLIRIANISNIIKIAHALLKAKAPKNTEIHLACYHSRQLLMLRSSLESKLDRILNRKNPDAIFDHPEIKKALSSSEAENHIFIVLGSPVTEVGRDHDYDWAIIEPSSARSIIQIAGRVWRHRTDKIAKNPNILIFNQNIKALKKEDKPQYTQPGFEGKNMQGADFLLEEGSLLDDTFLNKIDASIYLKEYANTKSEIKSDKPLSRRQQKEQAQLQQSHYQGFIPLEHAVFKHILNREIGFVAQYREFATEIKNARFLPMLADSSIISPFRKSTPQTAYVMRCDYHNDLYLISQESINPNNPDDFTQSTQCQYTSLAVADIQPWLNESYTECINNLMETFKKDEFKTAMQYATVNLDDTNITERWGFNEWLGFYVIKN